MRRLTRRGRAGLGGLVAVSAVVAPFLVAGSPAAPARASETYPRQGSTIQFAGHGYGHGRGMSQWGAYGAASLGVKYDQILSHYYPGTTQGSLSDGLVRVWISGDSDRTTEVDGTSRLALCWTGSDNTARISHLGVSSQVTGFKIVNTTDGLRLFSRMADGTFATTPWSSITPSGTAATFVVAMTDTPALSDCTPSASSPVVQLVRGSSREGIRGGVRAFADGAAPSERTVGVMTMSSYLRSVVPSEMPTGWGAEALKAQATAARTYAARLRSAKSYAAYGADVCDTVQCQVFSGTATEDTNGDSAVLATAGRYVLYGGAPALTEFSASNGGWSTSANSSAFPYLVAQPDQYDGVVKQYGPSWPNPHSWVDSVPVSTLEQAYGLGRMTAFEVTRRDGHGDFGGRVLEVRLVGTSKPDGVVVSGSAFQSVAGLQHSWWAPRWSGTLHELTANGTADIVARETGTGRLRIYDTTATGAAGPVTVQGAGWQAATTVLLSGDLTDDGLADMVAVTTAGDLLLYAGDGHGWVTNGRVIGKGWTTYSQVIAPGDWNGDGEPDLMGVRKSTGELVFYAGLGGGSFRPGVVIGRGWDQAAQVTGVGDLDGDGRADLAVLMKGTTGEVRVYHSLSGGGFGPTTVAASGWTGVRMMRGVGDYTADGRPDLVVVRSDGALLLYPGNGSTFGSARTIGAGWQALDLLG